MYFSNPRSDAKPVSFTAYSASRNPILCDNTELVPCAIFANGPQCTSAGVPSVVCTRFGSIASLSSAIIGPVAPSSRARTGSPARFAPMTIRPSRSRRSSRP